MSTEWLITNLLAAWALPPLCLIAGIAAGLALVPRRPRLGLGLAACSLAALAALSTGVVANELIASLESGVPPLTMPAARASGAGAIVVLGGGRRFAPEYGGETASDAGIARLRLGARLARETQLPLLVTGGRPDGGRTSEADVMAEALQQDFGVAARWREGESINTIENARFSARILAGSGIRRVILVTDAWHMPRSVERFRAAGLEVVPAPTGFASRPAISAVDFLPSAGSLSVSSRAFREWIGILVTRARGA